jgi:hypothetical protein
LRFCAVCAVNALKFIHQVWAHGSVGLLAAADGEMRPITSLLWVSPYVLYPPWWREGHSAISFYPNKLSKEAGEFGSAEFVDQFLEALFSGQSLDP